MIAAHKLGIQFGPDPLFEDVTFIISPGDRIGLVGANGAGKSTLMKALLGLQGVDEGSIHASRHAVLGYLPQEGVVLSDRNVREEVLSAFSEVTQLEREIEALTTEIGNRSNAGDTDEEGIAELLEDLGEMQHRFEAMNGFSAVGEVEKVLAGLGFEPEDVDRPCSTFSGGWQMRIELAKLLLRQPDLLMLDEPTNHLDIESLTWLETFLQRYQGAILMISHDRAFLDALTNRTFEMAMGTLTVYTGNYSNYLVQRTERREQQQASFENQQKKIAETERFIERFRYKATKATQVQSRVKALEKLERVHAPEPDESSVSFRFPTAPRSGRVVMELNHIAKSYDRNVVLRDVTFAIERGDKVAFLGRNGEGKSTFSRIIAGIEPFDSGDRIVGYNANVGYFAQHQAEDLDPRRTVLETLDDVATGDVRTKLRTLLGAFLFNGDDVFKPVSVLSGGEKARLALAKLLLEPYNLLIFDEPTNHLDMASKGVLKDALMAFDGALVIVSHDRDFLNGIVTKCVEFRAGAIREFLGGIGDYLHRHQVATLDDPFKGTSKTAETKRESQPVNDGLTDKERKRREAELRNRRYAATKDLKKKIGEIEKKIATLEGEKERLHDLLAAPETYNDPEKARVEQKRLGEVEGALGDCYFNWERLASQLEEIESGIE